MNLLRPPRIRPEPSSFWLSTGPSVRSIVRSVKRTQDKSHFSVPTSVSTDSDAVRLTFLLLMICALVASSVWSVEGLRGLQTDKRIVDEADAGFGIVMISLSSNRKTSPFVRATVSDGPEAQSDLSRPLVLVNWSSFDVALKRKACFIMFSSKKS